MGALGSSGRCSAWCWSKSASPTCNVNCYCNDNDICSAYYIIKNNYGMLNKSNYEADKVQSLVVGFQNQDMICINAVSPSQSSCTVACTSSTYLSCTAYCPDCKKPNICNNLKMLLSELSYLNNTDKNNNNKATWSYMSGTVDNINNLCSSSYFNGPNYTLLFITSVLLYFHNTMK